MLQYQIGHLFFRGVSLTLVAVRDDAGVEASRDLKVLRRRDRGCERGSSEEDGGSRSDHDEYCDYLICFNLMVMILMMVIW